jgi:hypothetical protein
MSESTFTFGQTDIMNLPIPPMEDPEDPGVNTYEPGMSLVLETVTQHVTKAYFMKENKQIDPPDGFELSDTVRHEVCHQHKGAYYLLEQSSYELRFDDVPVIGLCRPYCQNTLACNSWLAAGVFSFADPKSSAH